MHYRCIYMHFGTYTKTANFNFLFEYFFTFIICITINHKNLLPHFLVMHYFDTNLKFDFDFKIYYENFSVCVVYNL